MKAVILTLGISCIFLQAESMVNMCEKAYVVETQNNYSKIQKILNRNDRVEVLEKLGHYITSANVASNQSNDDRSEFEKMHTPQKSNEKEGLPVWAKTQDGYISFKCLVSEEDFKNIQKGDVRKKSGSDNKIAKKGFSESESGDSVAMKGAAGSAKMGRSNYQALNNLSNYYFENPVLEFEAFRKEAKLGEYR